MQCLQYIVLDVSIQWEKKTTLPPTSEKEAREKTQVSEGGQTFPIFRFSTYFSVLPDASLWASTRQIEILCDSSASQTELEVQPVRIPRQEMAPCASQRSRQAPREEGRRKTPSKWGDGSGEENGGRCWRSIVKHLPRSRKHATGEIDPHPEMAWTDCMSDLPINDWSCNRQTHAVTVDDQVFMFGYNKTCEEDVIQVVIFHPKSHTCSVINPSCRKEGSKEAVWAPKGQVVHFAKAHKGKVYVCVGEFKTLKGGQIHAFDTRTLQWSCATTTGDVPSGYGYMWTGLCTCEDDGFVYMYAENFISSDATYLWALDLRNLHWKIVATRKPDKDLTPRCIYLYKNRLYVLFECLNYYYKTHDYAIMHFDLATETWERLQLPATTVFAKRLWMTFIYRDDLYFVLNDERVDDIDLREKFGNITLNEVALRYSFAQNNWKQVWFKGLTPPDYLDMICLVENTAVFFSLKNKKAYVLDLLPSLR
ncbi:Kelch domain-containing protein 3, partial [Gryllus bimaculatus]